MGISTAIRFHQEDTMKVVAQIENFDNTMFHDSYPDLAQQHNDLMDNTNATQRDWSTFKYKLYRLIESLESLANYKEQAQ